MSNDRFVVVAEVRVGPGQRDSFLSFARQHADNSRRLEPGCRQFDVTLPSDDPDAVLFYEVYDSAEAFEAHRASPHLAWFREQTSGLVASRKVREFRRIADGSQALARRVLVTVPYLRQRPELMRPLEAAGFVVSFNERGRMLGEDELIAALPGHMATIASSEPYTERVFTAAPELRVVARLGVGWDRIDLAAATRHRVAVAMAFGTNHDAVADHAFALMAAAALRIVDYDRRVRRGGWGSQFHGRLYGSTVGIVGFGRIGRALARRCKGFGMEVLAHDPAMDADTVAHLGCRLVPLDDLLRRSDFVSLHAPLVAQTRHLINAERLALMRPSAVLVNTSRGGLIDEPALIEALRSGQIAAAGLDVFAQEPLVDSPLVELDNVVLTPHVAGSSRSAVEAMAARCVDSILTIARGELPEGGLVLNPEVLGGR
jgi:D-3-phosphoglycerate dehydrogenase